MKLKEGQFRSVKDELFEISGLFESGERKHHPFIVLNGDIVELCISPRGLLDYPVDTVVLAQWEGNYRSDWFNFTVADYMTWKAKGSRYGTISKVEFHVGPRGGFQYGDVKGVKGGIPYSMSLTSEHSRLEVEEEAQKQGIIISQNV